MRFAKDFLVYLMGQAPTDDIVGEYKEARAAWQFDFSQ